MFEKFVDELLDMCDKSIERMDKKCDNWKDFIDGKKEFSEVIKENTKVNLNGLNAAANLVSKLNEHTQYEAGRTKNLQLGDIVGVTRGFYEHYGVYAGENKVIHYFGESDTGEDNVISETSFYDFLKGSSTFFIVDTDAMGFKSFESSQVIENAKESIGKTKYNLLLNNCEHFAFWCKIGESLSFQKLSKEFRFYRVV